jgi:hypothetical protein
MVLVAGSYEVAEDGAPVVVVRLGVSHPSNTSNAVIDGAECRTWPLKRSVWSMRRSYGLDFQLRAIS